MTQNKPGKQSEAGFLGKAGGTTEDAVSLAQGQKRSRLESSVTSHFTGKKHF